MANDIVNDEEFKNDPEAGKGAKKYRLPFALCKQKGIAIQDWWTPRDAWNALRNDGEIQSVSEEYADFYRKKKREAQKRYKKEHPGRVALSKMREKTKKEQLASSEHTPDKSYKHVDGAIAGAKKSAPMTFEQADSGNCNPMINKYSNKTGMGWIGYHTNCQTCVATYIARKQGYNVRALPNLNNREIDNLSQNIALAYVKENGERYSYKDFIRNDKVFNGSIDGFADSEIKPGETHALSFGWRGMNSGHVIIAEKDTSGVLTIYDPQTAKVYKGREAIRKSRYFTGANRSSAKLLNLTNAKLDEAFCDKIMKNEGEQNA